MRLYTGPDLRDWQKKAILQWNNHRKGIIQAVPGAGKTFLAIKAFCDKLEEDSELKVLIVCPRLTLIEQWKEAILLNTSIKKSDLYEISSKNVVQAYKTVQNYIHKHKVFISTFHQIKQFFEQENWKENKWFLVVDEMHNTSENYLFPDEPIHYKLGLSATPRKKGKKSDFNLGGIVYSYSFSQALNDKIILDPVFKIILYSVNKPLFNKIQNTSEEDHEKNIDFVENAYDDFLHDEDDAVDHFTSKNIDFVGIQKILKNNFFIGTKKALQTLVFVNRIKKSDLLDEMLKQTFHENVSRSYHSQTEEYNYKGNFDRIKKKFEKKDFNVLISVGTLGEGIDFPYASHGIIASPVYNPTAFVQKVGRLLRSYQNHKQAVIYYYAPSELVSRLLTDEKIEPNYFKAVLKIADENKNLIFVDRQTLKEDTGSLAELLSCGAAYERNEDIKRMNVPKKLDAVLRFFKKIYPNSFKGWKELCVEDDFSLLSKEIAKQYLLALRSAKILKSNLLSVQKIQGKFAKSSFGEFLSIEKFVREALRNNIVTKIKYGQELVLINSGEETTLNSSEKEIFISAVKAEFNNFVQRRKQLSNRIAVIDEIILSLEKKKSDKDKIDAMFRLSQTFFKLQSLFLDQLNLVEITKNLSSESKFTLTIGQDIFLSKAQKRLFAFPEDFGFSRWKTPPKEELPKVLSKKELFLDELMLQPIDRTLSEKELNDLKQRIADKLKTPIFSNEEILEELEKHKFENRYSFEKIFFLTASIK